MNKLNTTFITDDSLHPGDIVKISPTDPTKVTKFSPDYVLKEPITHPNETLIDIVMYQDTTYILGYDNIGYFIYKNSKKIPLGQFAPIISSTGNIIVNNGYLYILIPYQGHFITSDGRRGNNNSGGLLWTLSLELKLLFIRSMILARSFLLFGSLFLLNGSNLIRFNPVTSPSWTTTIAPNFIGGCTLNEYIIVIHDYSIGTYSVREGILLSRQSVDNKLFACQTINSKVYIVTENNILYGTVSQLGYNIIGSHWWPETHPTLCNLGSFNNGFLVTTQNAIYIIDSRITTNIQTTNVQTTNVQTTIIPITGLATIRSYRIIPPESSDLIPCILNDITSIEAHIFSGPRPYAIQTTIQAKYPILAGMVIQVVAPKHVNVIFNGSIFNPPISVLPNHIYGIDIYGNLHMDDTKHPFLISGPDASVTIIYHS
jgi:hypothetical protein